MKTLLVLLVALALALAQVDMPAMYAGTNNGTTWNPPVLDEDVTPATCTAGTVTAYGSYFDYNVTVPGVFHVAVLVERDLKSNVQLFTYMHPFDPQAPCTNVIIKEWEKEIGGSGGPVIADFLYLGVGRYWFVITSSAADTVGQVSIQLYPPTGTGATTAASTTWDPAYDSSGCTGGASTGTPFGLFSWTQNGTGQYDLIVGFYNMTNNDFYYTYLDLYMGAITAAAINTDSCTAGWVDAAYEYGNGAVLWNQTLTNAQAYTVAVSGEYDYEIGYWGFWVVPTRSAALTVTPAWNQPERTDNCTASTSYTTTSWYARAIVATGQVVLIDTQDLPSDQGFSSIDTYSWFFRGNQSTAVPPPTCGGRVITYGDTGDITPVYGVTIPGRIYTVIVSTYGGGNSEAQVGVFTFTGTPIGYIPPSDETTGDGGDGGDGDGDDGDGDGDDDSAAFGLKFSVLLAALCAIVARFF